MDPRFVTQKIHAYLDYPVALSLIGLPFLLQLGGSHPMALWLAVATGVAAFVLTLLTDHETGVFPILSYPFHVAVDGAVGVVFILAPFVLGFTGIDAWYYWVNAAAVLTVIALSRPEADGVIPA
ncbi:MAG: SPW repeat domain-containing protein [Hyphomicrobiaceae bacterium]